MAEDHDKLTIETPELIPLELPLAGIGSRFLAAAVDTLIQFVASMALLVIALLVLGILPERSERASMWLFAIGILVAFLLQFGYFAGFEAWWNGQTPGKRHVHLRVIKDSGRPITVYESVARNLLRTVDSFPGFYGVGILTMLLSSKNKRLGDYVAGTVVVHEQPLAAQAKVGWTIDSGAAPCGYDLSRLSPEDFQLMESFLMRREQLSADIRTPLARKVALRIAAKLNIPENERGNPEALVEKLANEYRNRAQFR
jgi:uncharacterized RDD family membrane protein YckC